MVASARIMAFGRVLAVADLVVARFEREAVGRDGEQYAWTRLHVCEIRDGRLASMCAVRDRGRGSGVRLRRGADAGDRQPARGHQPGQPDDATASCTAMRARDVDGAVEVLLG